jgi:hypothetical protein
VTPTQACTSPDATEAASPDPTTPATTTPSGDAPAASGTTGLSLDLPLPLLGDVLEPALDGLVETAQPVLTLTDPVCTVDPGDDRGELTVAVQAPGATEAAEAPETTATTAPLVDLAAAGIELTIELSDGALAIDAQLPAGCEILDGGHTVRCTLDEALLGDETTLALELLGEESEIATVRLRQGDQTLDVRTVGLLGDLVDGLLPGATGGPEANAAPDSPTGPRTPAP